MTQSGKSLELVLSPMKNLFSGRVFDSELNPDIGYKIVNTSCFKTLIWLQEALQNQDIIIFFCRNMQPFVTTDLKVHHPVTSVEYAPKM